MMVVSTSKKYVKLPQRKPFHRNKIFKIKSIPTLLEDTALKSSCRCRKSSGTGGGTGDSTVLSYSEERKRNSKTVQVQFSA